MKLGEWGAIALVKSARQFIKQGEFRKALIAYEKAQTFDMTVISVDYWGDLCSQGSLEEMRRQPWWPVTM